MISPKTSTRSKKSPEVLRLKPKGDLVASTVGEERDTLLKALETAKKGVVLDMSGTEQIDSLGISLVLGLFMSCQKRKLSFSIEGVKTGIMRVFTFFRMTKLFPISGG